MNVGELLADKRICICGGSGGVGKTTISANMRGVRRIAAP